MGVIDAYLANIEPTKRAELERIRGIAHAMLPGYEEVISYMMPTIKYQGEAIIGFDAHKNHIGIYPFSGGVISKIKELAAYDTSPGAIREPLDNLLPKSLIEKIIHERLDQLGLSPK